MTLGGRWTVATLGRVGSVALAVAGCGSDEAAPACVMVAGECVGVPAGRLCEDSVCTAGVACSAVVVVEDDAGLQAAAQSPAGTCLALMPGGYGSVALAGGVSLLGRHADEVSIASVAVASGGRSMMRGLAAQNVELEPNAEARLEAVRATSVVARAGAQLELAVSEMRGASLHALLALDAKSLRLERTWIEGAAGPGIWAQCAAGCGCSEKPLVALDRVLLSGNRHVGLALYGVEADLSQVIVAATEQRELVAGGGAVMIASCADVSGDGLTVDGAFSFGVLVSDANATLGAPGGSGVHVTRTTVGLWVASSDGGAAEVGLQGAIVTGNAGVGLGASGKGTSLSVRSSRIESTAVAKLPTIGESAAIAELGDGLSWSLGAKLDIEGLTIAGSAGQSLLIDGPVGAGSRLAEVALEGGDEGKGIVQQGVSPSDETPTAVQGVPPINKDPDRPHAVAERPAMPAAL